MAAGRQCEGHDLPPVRLKDHDFLCPTFLFLTGISGPGGTAVQAAALEAEGVPVQRDSMGEFYVDLMMYGWFPRRLPNDSGDSEEEDER